MNQPSSTPIKLAFEADDFFSERPEKILRLNEAIAPILNELHEVDLSSRFWLRLLGKHLRSCVNQAPFFSQPIDRHHLPLTPINSFRPITRKQAIRNNLMYWGQAYLHRSSTIQIQRILEKHDRITTGPRSQIIAHYNGGGILPQWFPIRPVLFPSLKKRKNLIHLSQKSEDLLTQNSLQSLPKIFVEYFSAFYSSIPTIRPQNKSFHFEHLDSPYSEFVLAKYQENGSQIIAHQTGGYMGEIHNHPDMVFYETVNELRTYGWSTHPKDRPDRAYRLETYHEDWKRFNKLKLHQNESILLILPILNEFTRPKIDKFLLDFFNTISRDLRKKIIIRPRPISRRLNNRSQMLSLNWKCDDVQIDDGKSPIAKIASDSSLIIQAWLPSTNFLECLSVNQPVIALNSNQNPSPAFLDFVPWLKSSGILHDDGCQLANFLNSLGTFEHWWQGVRGHPCYERFTRTFCGTAFTS